MRRVTLDSNIYVSGFVFGGQPKRLLEMANDRDIHLAVSGPIIEEVQRVLMRKFGWSEVRASDVRGVVRTYAQWVEPKEELDVVKDDPTDNKVLECAAAAGSEVIVSGDRHLLRLGSHQGIKIMTVAEFLASSQARGR